VSPTRGRLTGHGGTALAYGQWPGAGAPIVGVHGMTASHLNFVGIADRLRGRRPLFALDLRGRGESEKPDAPYGLDTHAADVAALMRAFALGPSVVVGHSLGAYISIALASAFPELVSALVLIDGGHPFPHTPGVDARALAEVGIAPILARIGRSYVDHADHERRFREQGIFAAHEWSPWMTEYLAYALGGETPAMREKTVERAVRADLTDLIDTKRVEARWRSIRVPVLLLRAEFGFTPHAPALISDQSLANLRRLCPHLEEQLIRGTNHYTLALAEPGASIVTEALLEVVERVETGTQPTHRAPT
jgi:pimeloyl-ACP methyl ester carboxylesterase